jgi:8-oxo-dGTP pyrophosphatase MutT (NUDIX family)
LFQSEEIYTGAVREVKEETGVRIFNLVLNLFTLKFLFQDELIVTNLHQHNKLTLNDQVVPIMSAEFLFILQVDTEFVEVIAFRLRTFDFGFTCFLS